jgi:hypothetical protein
MIPAAQPAERSVSRELPKAWPCPESWLSQIAKDLTLLAVFRFEQERPQNTELG